MARLKNGTWVVIADGEKALILENVTDGEDPYLVVRKKREEENPPAHEQGADKPGRMPDVGRGHRSALDDTDWHQLQKERFAADLADLLYAEAHKGRFEHLVLVASPNILGELRDNLHKEVADKIVAEIDKTLTNHPVDEIEKIVTQELEAA